MKCSYLKSCTNPAAEGKTKCEEHLAALAAYGKAWRDKNRDRVEARRRQLYAEAVELGIGVWSRGARRYGLTREEYVQMLDERDRLCDICKQPERVMGAGGRIKNLAIDHDHETGRVRGLLCNNCNRAIGLLGDSAELLEAAVAYLKASAGLMA